MTDYDTTKTLSALDWLRFPMALCVVFIHSYGMRVANCAHIVADPISWESFYDAVRIFGSKVFPLFAVPTFFLISGYLFFRNLQNWDRARYHEKLRRRVHTLLIPYLGWNAFHCLHLSWPTLMRIAQGEAQWGQLWGLWKRLGGWGMFWNGHLNLPVYDNILGISMPFTGPVLAPLWFVRDLMVIILFAPLIHWLLRHSGKWVVALLGICFYFNIWLPLPGTSATCTFWFVWGAWHAIQGRDLVASMRQRRYITYPIALVTMFLLLYLRCTIPGPDSLGLRLLNTLYILTSVISVVSVAGAVVQRGKPLFPGWLIHSTFFIYVSHIFVRKQVMRPFLPLIRSGSYPIRTLVYVLIPLLTVAACLLLYQSWRKILSLHKSKQPFLQQHPTK